MSSPLVQARVQYHPGRWLRTNVIPRPDGSAYCVSDGITYRPGYWKPLA